MFAQILTMAYASVGVIATIGYIPTIKDLLINKKMSANIMSYVAWTFCAGTTWIYTLARTQDWLLQLVTGLNFGCCALVLILAILLKLRTMR